MRANLPRYSDTHLDDLAKWLHDNSRALNERARFAGIALNNQQRWSFQEHHLQLASRDSAEDARREAAPQWSGIHEASGLPIMGEL